MALWRLIVTITVTVSAVMGVVRHLLCNSVCGPTGWASVSGEAPAHGRSHRVLVAVAVVAACFVTGMARAQVTTATVYGIVQDPSGGAIPGATVTVTNENTSANTSD